MSNQNDITYENTSSKNAHKNDSSSIDLKNNDHLIGQRLKELRKQKALTQKDVANAIGVSAQQIQKYEKGQDRISFSRIFELSQFMNISIESFTLFHLNENSLSDNDQASIKGSINHRLSEAEKNEILSVFSSIEDEAMRKDLLNLMKTMAKTSKE